MRSSSMEAIRKHLGKSVSMKVGDDYVEWPSLDPEHLDRLFGMIMRHQDAAKDNRFDKSVVEDVYVLGVASMKKIYPELSEAEMRQFIAANFFTVLMTLAKANNLIDDDVDLAKIKEKIGQLPATN